MSQKHEHTRLPDRQTEGTAKKESDPPLDCDSCQESGMIDRFGNQRECGSCSLWHASYEAYCREIEAFEV